MSRLPVFLCASALGLALCVAAPVEVHEWGTFTSLQDEDGKSVSGINTDDEPVPAFVHDIAQLLLIRPTEAPPAFFQGAPSCHPDVTMRLETPVLYVHAPPELHPKLNITVSFRGGWLTQFYPDAEWTAPGVDPKSWRYGPLTHETVGKLAWHEVAVNAGATGPATEEPVWLAPRQVSTAQLQVGKESERFLFYRGVGHLDAPLRVVRNAREQKLEIWRNPAPAGLPPAPASAQFLWLVDIRPGGIAASRSLTIPAAPAAGGPLAVTPAEFEESEYRPAGTDRFHGELKDALLREGLFDDEAEALLETWKVSYFKAPGTRLFFLVPPAWTNAVLPLEIEGAPSALRVMAGRIELVTPAQRLLLKEIAETPMKEGADELRTRADRLWQNGQNQKWNDLLEGKRTFEQAGIEPPAAYQAYLKLGRFRNALVLDEYRRNPSPHLREFIEGYRLEGYAP